MSRATATVVKLRPSTSGLRCSECGASAKAACNCGAAYVPAGLLAAKALKADPRKSDRAIAGELGIDHMTVAKARKATGEKSPVERVGKDGKVRRLPTAKRKPKLTLQAQVNRMVGPPALLAQNYIVELEQWLKTKPPLPEDAVMHLLNVLHLCAESCERVAQSIDKQYPREKAP